uniref:GT23 domain-containing protein n=1 Tax=Meloidogyne floridensis TaxID=298350 RepID=A0A915NX25_9BILA
MVRPFLPLSKYKSTEQQDKVLLLRIRYEVERELILPHSPEAVPLEFKEILTEHHTNPPAWFMGQIIKFVLRENQTTSAKLDKVEATFNLGNASFAGIHVRRTDKGVEAPFQKLDEYMKWIDFWYNSEEIKIQNSKLNSKKQQKNKTLNKRRLFIATDEPKTIIEELRKSWGSQYELLHNKINASYGNRYNDPQRRSEESFLAIFAEIRTLAKCRFVVCTFSSNVCRLVYELMQAYQGYAGDNVYSIDYDYAERGGGKL